MHSVSTITPPAGYDTITWMSFVIQMYAKPASGNSAVWEIGYPKLEFGNRATDWSPAPEDPAQALDTGSGIHIRKDNVRIVTPVLDIAAVSEDGEEEVARFDEDGLHAKVVEAEEIVSDSVVKTHAGGTVTPANAGALAELLEDLSGKFLTSDLTVSCGNVTGGSFELHGVHGDGHVQFTFGTLNGLTVRNCNLVRLYKTAFSTGGTALTADHSTVYIQEGTFNAQTGIALEGPFSGILVHGCSGTTTTLLSASFNTTAHFAGTALPYGVLSRSPYSEVYNATGIDFRSAPDPSIPTVQVVTASLSPTSTSTSGYGSKLYQGRYSPSQSFRKGVMLFTLPSDLVSADKIDSATLTLKRIAGVGGSSAVVQVRCYNAEGTVYASKSVNDGATVNLDVTAAVKAMKTSGYTGLMLWNPSTATPGSKTYTVGYARFAGKGEAGEPVLKVSYRK